MSLDLPGVHAAPNIQDNPDAYELENAAADADGTLRAAVWAAAPWAGAVVVDLGCGTGFHVPRFAASAAHVFGVEPDDALRARALHRVGEAGLTNVSVMTGSAERILLPDGTADVVHSMFAYFFGPGSEPGLAEVARVLRPGGRHVVVENDWTAGTFAGWLRRSAWTARFDPDAIPPFWAAHGYTATPVRSRLRFASRADLERVLAIELPPELVDQIRREHHGTEVDYRYVVYARGYGPHLEVPTRR